VRLFKGHAAGPHHNESGSGSNFLCLHEEPQWKRHIDGRQRWTGSIYGVEYETFTYDIFSESNNGGRPLANNPAPCAVCYVQGRSTVLMIPARTQCPDGWLTEYAGYLVSESTYPNRKRSSYICWEEAPEITAGNIDQDQSVVYFVEVECGSLPCSLYVSGRELTCVVCSK